MCIKFILLQNFTSHPLCIPGTMDNTYSSNSEGIRFQPWSHQLFIFKIFFIYLFLNLNLNYWRNKLQQQSSFVIALFILNFRGTGSYYRGYIKPPECIRKTRLLWGRNSTAQSGYNTKRFCMILYHCQFHCHSC